MENQIISAIQIAWNPKADQNLKKPAFELVNGLRQEPTAWQPCLAIFTHLPRHEDVVRVFSLEIVNNAIKAGLIDQPGLNTVRTQLMTYLQREYTSLPAVNIPTAQGLSVSGAASPPPDSSIIENKIAQAITSIFCALYDSVWPTFFDDILTLTSTSSGRRDNLIGVAFYLRVVNNIHDEIGDVLQARSREEQDRANTLKDLIRARDVKKIASAWQEVLSEWGLNHGAIGELSMMGISKWVSWIDVSLIVNQPMLRLISQQVEQKSISDLPYEEERARDTAIEALTEIVSKKMSSADKINLIDFVGIHDIVTRLSDWPILEQKSVKYDVDLAEYVAKLVNAVLLDIIQVLDGEQQDSDTWRRAERMLQDFLPHLLRYFKDDFDDVCMQVLPAMTDVLTFLRKAFQGDEFISQRTATLYPILQAIFTKSRVDNTADFDDEYDGEGTEEAEFLELRKKLSNLQTTVAATDEHLYIEAVSALVVSTFEQLQTRGQRMNWRDLDLALHEMYLLGDLVVKSGGLYQKNKPNSAAAERLIQMMLLMIQSNAGSYPVPGVQIQCMEICVRYSSFFEKQAQFLPPVLQIFLQSAHSDILRVKRRSWYLLQRLIKQQRHNIGPFADTIVPSLQDLLLIKAEIPNSSDDEDSDDQSNDSTFNSQLYLFESIGCIISTNNVPQDKQIQYARIVMQPIFTSIQNNLNLAKTNKQACLQVHHDIMALGNIARGYFDWQGTSTFTAAENVPGPIREAFAQVSEVTLVALENLKTSADVRSAARFTFTRLLAMVGQHMLPQLHRWVASLLTESSSRDEMAQLLRLLDHVTYGFKNEVFNFLDTLFGDLLQRVWAGIAASPIGTDDEVELAELKREYVNFFLILLGNGLGSVIISPTNQPHFETVLETLEHFAKDTSDILTAKLAFQLLSRMCMVWGGIDVIQGQTPNDAHQANQQELPGFKQFVVTRFSPLCWSMPQNPNFNPKDAQSRQVLMEAAGLQKTIYAKNGQEYINYLQNTELPSLGFQTAMIQNFLNKFTSTPLKDWKTWFARFVSSGGAA